MAMARHDANRTLATIAVAVIPCNAPNDTQ